MDTLDKNHTEPQPENQTELYTDETSFKDYTSDTSIIIKYQYLPYVVATQFVKNEPFEPPLSIEWYPMCNAYYNYTEDVDYKTRVDNFLTNKPSFDSLKSVQKIEHISEEDPYTIRDAQIRYLQSLPVCFIIFGKPGSGSSELGRLMADHWKCCYIDPQSLIEEEIQSNSRIGQCIEFNLRCGRAIGVDVMLRLLNKRVNSKTANHRGFVISGFPLIGNDLYEEDPVSSESAVFNVHEIFEEVFDNVLDIGVPPQVIKHVSMASKVDEDEDVDEEEVVEEQENVEEEEEIVKSDDAKAKSDTSKAKENLVKDLGSTDINICTADEIGTSYEDQIAYIFSLCNMPLILIYVSCPNADIVERRANNRFDMISREIINTHKISADKAVYTVYTKDPNVNIEQLDHTQPIFLPNSYDTKLLLPYDFPANVLTTLETYRLEVLRHIENRALMHDQQYFIKLDGRFFPNHLFNVLKFKIGTLPIHYVSVPTDMNVPQDVLSPEDIAEPFDPDENSAQDCFLEFHNKQTINKMFKWSLSNWRYQCPVALSDGRYETGLGRYAVRYMNQIFFLSDEERHEKFIRNPRKYLLPPFPKPNCKIFVIGPKHSGKTAVAKCLSYLLNGQYVCPKKIETDYLQKKHDEFEDMLRSVALSEAISLLKEMQVAKWAEMQAKRLQDIQDFIQLFKGHVQQFEAISAEYIELTAEVEQVSSFSIAMKRQFTPEEQQRKAEIKKQTEFLIGHFRKQFKLDLNDPKFRSDVLDDSFDFNKIVPRKLLDPPKKDAFFQTASVHHPFVVDYVRKSLDSSKKLSVEMESHLMKEMFRSALSGIEQSNKDIGINGGGWVIDGMPLNIGILESLAPDFIADDIIVLRDNDDHSFLLERFFYKGRNDFNDYRTFFKEIGKRDAAWRSPTVTETDSMKVRLVARILDEMLDPPETSEESTQIDDREEYFRLHPTRALIKQYEEHLNEFDEKYEEVYQHISEYGKNIIEVDISGKEIPTILKEIVKIMDNKYQQDVHVQTPDDKIQEMADFGGDEANLGEEMGGEDVGQTEDPFLINRRLGDTNYYCPVAWHEFNVLWKGKEEYSASYENKIYFFHSEAAMHAFVNNPNGFLTGVRPNKIPPPRISVVGIRGSGKKTVAKLLANNYGLYYFDLEKTLKTVVDSETFHNYIYNDTAISEDILSNLLVKYFSQDPLRDNGVVMVGFPRRSSDVAFMKKHGVIPDIIIELSCLQIEVYNRIMDKDINDWKIKMELDQKLQDELNRETFMKWEDSRQARLQELINLKRDQRYYDQLSDEDVTLEAKISFDSVQDAQDVDEIMQLMDIEFPEPVFEDHWETLEEAVERFETEIGISYELETNYLEALREICEAEQISWSLVDANVQISKVLNQILRATDNIKFRNESFFERCYDITIDTAEKLLENGYYFISRFGRTCPVQIFDKEDYVQLYNPLQALYEIYPIIYRNYIYYIAGKVNRLKFIDNPIKYVIQKFKQFSLIHFRLAVIGPPKCGKTILAERFQRDYGFKVISVGKAARYVLKFLRHSKLAKDIQSVLEQGWELTSEMAAKCIEAMLCDGKCVTQGFILDGFPNNREDVKHLADLGIMPYLIMDIQAPLDESLRCLSLDKGKHNMPKYSKQFITHRHDEYEIGYAEFRQWVDEEYQNITKINITPCRWGVWTEAKTVTSAVISEVKQYHSNAGKEMALSLSYMLVTPLEFLEREHPHFKHYCPACLQIGTQMTGGNPPDRTGLVQYKKYFYWICNYHLKDFMDTPEIFLPPWNASQISDCLPIRLHPLKPPLTAFNKGYCVVCYTKHLPQHVLNVGVLDYICSYMNNTYLFDTLQCLEKFFKQSQKYFQKSCDVVQPMYLSLECWNLPTMGMLEQHCARQLVKALTNVSERRPVLPGLTISQAALICTGLFLKLHNPKTTEKLLLMYEKAQNLFDDRCTGLLKEIEVRKKYLNPYIWYEEPLPEKCPQEDKNRTVDKKMSPEQVQSLPTSSSSSMFGLIEEMLHKIKYSPNATRRVPVPDDRFDYLCQFFKPASKVPAFLNVVDIAGLVKGASEGQGLGNAFLSHISACDAIFHLCRAFEDDEVIHVEGDVNPVRDLEIIGEELRLKDEETLLKKLEGLERTVIRGNDKKMKPEYDILCKVKGVLVDEKQHIRFHDWNVNDIEVLNKYLFLTSKPMIYLINLSEKDYIKKKNKWLLKIKEWVDKNDPGSIIIPFSGSFEFKLVEFQDNDLAKRYMEDNNCTSALDKIILQGYKALQLEYFFTSGADEVKAWTIQKGTKAPQAAGRIHTDFEKGFIMADVMKFADFKEEGSENGVKAAGKYRQQGRNYTVEDGDIIFFKFNAGAGLKDPKKK